MNYYEHHLGDYDGATAHLTWAEDCAYRRLICLYYRTEAPIPADIKQAWRLVRAKSKDERDAVEQVLREFFDLRDDGWHNARCDADIGAFHDSEPDREAKRENAKERQRRARERRRQLFEDLRRHNEVPAWDTPTKTLESLLVAASSRATSEPVTPPVTEPVTRDDTVAQTPPPTTHTQSRKEHPLTPKGGEGRFPDFWSAWPTSARKQDRKKCLAKWQRCRWDAEADAIVAHVEAMKGTKQWLDGYEPAPLTYLNGERWRDGVPVAGGAAAPADSLFEGVH